ncbi:MAG: metallophosphoesterase [Nitrososphaerota archaeon]|nr:metallophosphoesterase [Nitrososphaerota archaeon]MDG6932116.1 metallophosphoesterase [Nitrososphaerota archaeon]MDG6936671.1 metallophosphoesterase [Nitrososphaerota archaeon]MDG6944277.1 metallophosphoesterase [Nitrososphaerota archaeon]
MGSIKLFFATDLHGSEKCFRKFISASKAYSPDIMVIGGDLTGKAIIPFVVKSSGVIMADYFGQKMLIESKDQERRYAEEAADYGYYPYKIGEGEYDNFMQNEKAVNRAFLDLMKERLEKWVRLAETELRGVTVIINAGNDDPMELDSILDSSSFVIHPEGRVIELNGHEMISTGFANMTPWHAPRDIPEEALRDKIDEMASKLKEPGKSIFNIHPPPFNSGLDVAPKLDAQFRPVTVSGMPVMEAVGSRAVREMLEKYHPMLGLHGHVHESRGAKMLNWTLVINPGSDYQYGILRGALVNIGDSKIISYILTGG